MENYAVLIDGGFAKRKLGTQKSPATAQDFLLLSQKIQKNSYLKDMRLHRVYYYDALPFESSRKKPLDGSEIDFGKDPIVLKSHALFRELAKLNFFSLRLGELSLHRWVISPKTFRNASDKTININENDLRPDFMQKGVDMRIGMDIAALALKKQVQVIVLVSGDSDFIPAMKFARREGIQVYLAPLGHRQLKSSMLEHSDLLIDLECSKKISASCSNKEGKKIKA